MFKLEKIKGLMPFMMGIITYHVVTSILNLLDKNTLLIRYMTALFVIIVYAIAIKIYDRNKS